MNRIIITEDYGRKYYLYNPNNEKIKHMPIIGKNIETLLTDLLKSDIKKLDEKSNLMEMTFKNNSIVRIYSQEVFKEHFNSEDTYFRRLSRKIKLFIEKENLKKHKTKLPPKHYAKVNRNKNKQLPTKAIVTFTSAITACIIIANIALANKDAKKPIINIEKPKAKTEAIVKSNSPIINDTINKSDLINAIDSAKKALTANNKNIVGKIISENGKNIIDEVNLENINVQLDFDDATANGKLSQTIENCSPYLDYWIERYGLPKDLTYALVCQEYGELDCTINSGGACGPMQLQVEAFHNDSAIEYLKVPVYENGKLTGEYDEFYVADERKLDDPRLIGQNYLVMQNLNNNFQIGCAQFRRCIDTYKNIFLAVDAYNKGLYATSSICSPEQLEHYKNDFSDFTWTNIIPQSYGVDYGDPNYIWNVLRYLDTGTRGKTNIKYYYNGELISIDLTNTNVYNSELAR